MELFALKGLLPVEEKTLKVTLLLYISQAVFQRTTEGKQVDPGYTQLELSLVESLTVEFSRCDG